MENKHELKQVGLCAGKDSELPEFLFKTLVILKNITFCC